MVKQYGPVTAVDGLTLTAEAGQVTAVLGPNGAGKTTTIEVCEGYRRIDSGTVRILGLDPMQAGAACHTQLKSARLELPGATRLERFMSHARNPHSTAPAIVAAWPVGPDWPNDHASLRDVKRLKKLKKLSTTECRTRPAR